MIWSKGDMSLGTFTIHVRIRYPNQKTTCCMPSWNGCCNLNGKAEFEGYFSGIGSSPDPKEKILLTNTREPLDFHPMVIIIITLKESSICSCWIKIKRPTCIDQEDHLPKLRRGFSSISQTSTHPPELKFIWTIWETSVGYISSDKLIYANK